MFMVVTKIQDQIVAYKKWLNGMREHPNAWWCESVLHFQTNWNPDTPDPAAMFDASFQNAYTRRLWQSDNWRPKEIMRLFYGYQPIMVKAMFDDLFNETKEVENRISRFLFGLDTLLSDYKSDHVTSVENNHYHDDYRMIALYLAFQYPDQYAAPYDFALFSTALQRLGARELPQVNDLPRFFKVHRTLMTFLDKDPQVAQAFERHLHPRKHYQGRNLMLAVDFSRFVAR
jgi:hypothetical protein